MGRFLISLVVAACTLLPVSLTAQDNKLTPSALPEFLAAYDKHFDPLEALYTELIEEKLPLRDDEGQPLGRRPIEDRRQALTELREMARQLAAHPEDLVLTARVVFRTENLADDLFDLSQIAYDNDREELARRLSDLQAIMDHNKDMLANYFLDLADQDQQRLQQLEKENADLQQRLKEAGNRRGTAARKPAVQKDKP